MGDYGYLHLARVLSYDEARNAYSLQSVSLARGARWPPVPSCVPGLQPGDRVILAAKGTSRDDLVIIGKLGAGFPGITDIAGLVAALAAKADDTDITALDGRLDTAEGELVTLDGRLDAAEGELVTLDGRLDTAEATLTSQGTTLTDLSNRFYAVELNPIREDRDLYGDLVSSCSRDQATGSITLTNGTLYLVRVFGRAALTATQIRAVTAVAGTVGTCAVGLYAGTATNSLPQVRSGTIGLTTLGRVTHTLSSGYTGVASAHYVIALLPTGYTVAPQLGGRVGVVHSSMLNPSVSLNVSVTKAGQSSLPASIDLTDGTWTATGTSKPWVALG